MAVGCTAAQLASPVQASGRHDGVSVTTTWPPRSIQNVVAHHVRMVRLTLAEEKGVCDRTNRQEGENACSMRRPLSASMV